MVRLLSNLSEHLRTLRGLTATRLRSANLDQKLHDLRDDVGNLDREVRTLPGDLRILNEELRGLSDRVARLFTEWRGLRRDMDQNNGEMESYRSRIADYREEMSELAAMIDLQRRSYVGISRQLASVERAEAEAPAPAPDPFLSVFRQELLDHVRGSPDEIRHRLGIYIPNLTFDDQREKPRIVDLGSGRGEWLELVSEANHPITGVFPDETTAPDPQPAYPGMEVVIADALDWLRRQPDRSVDMITAFQVIERMSIDRLVAMLKEVMRVLRPGGRVILETPNPENIIVGAHTFWLDPDRVRPLPPALMEQLMRSLAFTSVEVLRLPPHEAIARYRNPETLPGPLHELFSGSDNYAVIALKN